MYSINYWRKIFLLSVLCLTPFTPLLAQSNRNAINGVVTDTSRNPVASIWLELLNEVDAMIARARTDSTGHYAFRNLSFGTFQVRVVASGTNFASQTIRVSLYPASIQGAGAHYEQLDLMLKTVAETKGVPPSKTRTVFAQEVPTSAKKLYETAIVRLDSHDSETGIAKLKEALAVFPSYYLALERLGVEYLKLNRYDEAAATLNKAIEVNPTGAPSLYALGVVHYQAKQWATAAEVLQRSLILEPESANAAFVHLYLGLAQLKTEKFDDAESHLKKAIETGGERIPADVHMYLAECYDKNKRYKEAADELELFLKRVPDARDAANIRNLITKLRAKAQSG